MPSNIDEEKIKKTIALVLDKMGTEADPMLLSEYYSLFKKEIPLFHRSKAGAYLLMLFDQGKTFRYAGRNDYSRMDKNGFRKGGREKRDTEPRSYPLAEEESKRLFFSIGRSRRIFPREILGLINTKTAIPKEDIGAIRILDNYSFVQVRDTQAERIIEALNGMIFRGRPLTVNYAKSRRDEENAACENETYSDTGEEESFDEYVENGSDSDNFADDALPDSDFSDDEFSDDEPPEEEEDTR
jgi:hypothetical protein